MTPEIEHRKSALFRELSKEIGHAAFRAQTTHWAALLLGLLAVASSLVAGILGLAKLQNQAVVGVLALVPAAAAILATRFQLQARSDWHYRKFEALKVLKSRLVHQLPEIPTADDIALIAHDRDILIARMLTEWQSQIVFDWNEWAKAAKLPISAKPRGAGK